MKKIFCLSVILAVMCSVAAAAPVKKQKANKQPPPAMRRSIDLTRLLRIPTPEAGYMELRGEIEKLKAKIDKPQPPADDIKVSGLLWFSFAGPLQNSAILNNFDVTRAYLTIKKGLQGADLQITLDAARNGSATSTQNLYNFLKYAFVEVPAGDQKLRFGLQQTVWISWAEKFWGNTFIAKNFVDIEGLMSSADFGLGALGKINIGRLPEVEFHATLVNGPGFKSAENNQGKDASLRLNSTLFENDGIGALSAGGFVSLKDLTFSGGGGAKLAGLLLGLKNKIYGNVYGEYIRGTNISGYSAGGFYRFRQAIPGLALLARIDNYDPDLSISNDEIKRLVYGISCDMTKDITIAFDTQDKTVGTGLTERIGYLHSQIAF